MIVGEHETGTAMLGGISDDCADWKVSAAFVALVAGQMEASRLIIDVSDPQTFAFRCCFAEAAAEERLGGCKPIELQRVFGTLIPHAVFVRRSAGIDAFN